MLGMDAFLCQGGESTLTFIHNASFVSARPILLVILAMLLEDSQRDISSIVGIGVREKYPTGGFADASRSSS